MTQFENHPFKPRTIVELSFWSTHYLDVLAEDRQTNRVKMLGAIISPTLEFPGALPTDLGEAPIDIPSAPHEPPSRLLLVGEVATQLLATSVAVRTTVHNLSEYAVRSHAGVQFP